MFAFACACGGDVSRGVVVRSSDDFVMVCVLWKVYDVVLVIDLWCEVYLVFEGCGGGDDVGMWGDAREDEEEDEETRDDDADAEVECVVCVCVVFWSVLNVMMCDDGSDGMMDKVSVGGMFDCLYVGYRLLFASAFRVVVGGGVLYVGVMFVELFVNKVYGVFVELYVDCMVNVCVFLVLCDLEFLIEV